MTGRAPTTAWTCPSGCYRKRHVTRKPCRLCCGYTADSGKHLQGGSPAATKN